MKIKDLKLCGKEDISGKEMQTSIIPVCFLTFFLTLTFMTASLKLLMSTYSIENCLYFLGDKSPIIVNISSSVVVLLFWIMFFAPAYIGMHEYFTAPLKDEKQTIDLIFNWYSFKRFFISLKTVLSLILLKLFMLICFCAPSVLIFIFTFKCLFDEGIFKSVAYIIFAGAGVMLILGLISYLCAVERYAPVPYIISINPKIKLREALKASRKIMEGEYLHFLLFKLSFSGWFLSCIFLFPVFFVFPYYKQSCTEWIFYTANKQKY